MKRGGNLRRSTFLRRGKWTKGASGLWEALDGLPVSKHIGKRRKRDEQRDDEEFARKWGSLERIYIVKSLACIVPGCGRTPCENAHGDEGKEGAYKAGYLTICPLCAGHHRTSRWSYHALGSQAAFEAHWLEPHDLTWAFFANQTEEIVQARGADIIQIARMTGGWQDFEKRYAA